MPPSSRHRHGRRHTGPAFPVDPRPSPADPVDPRAGPADLPYPKIHDEPLRCCAAVMDPRNEFDQTGCAWPRAPLDPADARGQGEWFTDDYSQPDAAASKPVFWTEPTRPDDQRHPPANADAADRGADTAPAAPSAGHVPANTRKPALNL